MLFHRTLKIRERRRAPRWAVGERGSILVNGAARGCKIVDISPYGARLQLGADYPLPIRFDVQLASRRRPRPAQLVWQRGAVAAVQFDGRLGFWERIVMVFWAVMNWLGRR